MRVAFFYFPAKFAADTVWQIAVDFFAGLPE
jgi:hypothetical protein